MLISCAVRQVPTATISRLVHSAHQQLRSITSGFPPRLHVSFKYYHLPLQEIGLPYVIDLRYALRLDFSTRGVARNFMWGV